MLESLSIDPQAVPLASRYASLPEHFYARLAPTPVAAPRLIRFNHALAAELGLAVESVPPEVLAATFAGNLVPPGANPVAMAYAGHQFGQFVPQLGDGRAILLGEVRDRAGSWRDIHLKGSGRTPYSRNGDGRAALGPVLREYLVSEAMHALGIPATRALAAVSTGQPVYREERLPGAVFTRVATSHVRVGTFQYFAARGDTDAVRRLADFVIERLYPEVHGAERPCLELLRAVTLRQALLVARWMQVGFIHGVMNTDNMALSGESIDFGPCAFIDAYDPAAVFSSIDGHGRYAYSNQPHAALWNLARFAETLLPCIDPEPERAVELATAAVNEFVPRYTDHWLAGMRRKLGLTTAEAGDRALVEDFLEALHRNQADFTLSFRALCDAAEVPGAGPGADVDAAAAIAAADAAVRGQFAAPADYDAWALRWRERLGREPAAPAMRAAAMRTMNPRFIPRNHRIEQAIEAAVARDDFAPFETLLSVLARPYDEQSDRADYAAPPQPAERVVHTFCGT